MSHYCVYMELAGWVQSLSIKVLRPEFNFRTHIKNVDVMAAWCGKSSLNESLTVLNSEVDMIVGEVKRDLEIVG